MQNNGNTRHSRFAGAKWYNPAQGKDIIVGGAGGIGSHAIFALARVGYNLSVYDMDRFEEHNIGAQLCGPSHVGSFKADAIKEVCSYLGCSGEIEAINEPYDTESYVDKIMVAAFDNIETRKLMFMEWAKNAEQNENWKDVLFVDGRK